MNLERIWSKFDGNGQQNKRIWTRILFLFNLRAAVLRELLEKGGKTVEDILAHTLFNVELGNNFVLGYGTVAQLFGRRHVLDKIDAATLDTFVAEQISVELKHVIDANVFQRDRGDFVVGRLGIVHQLFGAIYDLRFCGREAQMNLWLYWNTHHF